MNCKCGGDTRVVDSRHPKPTVIKRTRACEACGERFHTFESRQRPYSMLSAATQNAERKRRERQEKPERIRAMDKRHGLRKAAREEAAEKGIPAEAIYQQWGIA